MPRRSRLAVSSLFLLAACGARAADAPRAVVPRAGELPGRLALAPSPVADDGLPYWVPVDRATVVVPVTDPPVSFGATLLAVPHDGKPVEVRHAGRARIPYGCDGGTLEVERFEGATRLPPGPVWLLPAPPPTGWALEGVPLVTETTAPERRAWRSGRLRVTLERRDATHADLAVSAGDRRLWGDMAEKHDMEGAEETPIDLTLPHEIGMPMPAALFRVAPGGPALLVFASSGYESARLHAVLVDDAGGVAVPDSTFDVGLYFCAF